MKKERFEDSYSSEQFAIDVLDKLKGASVMVEGFGDVTLESNHNYISHGLYMVSGILNEAIQKADEYRRLIANLENKQDKTTNININVGA